MKYLKNALFLILFIFSCASFGAKKENDALNAQYRLRYINLSIIFEYLTLNDTDARNIKKQKEDIIQKIDAINIQLADTRDEAKRNEFSVIQIQYKLDLVNIKGEEERFKSKMLNMVDRALENLAKSSDIDFIFNIGEGTVYARKEYDITEEVLRDIIRQKERSAPAVR